MEIGNVADKIREADQRIDRLSLIDEERVISKIGEIDMLFQTFKQQKLSKLKQTLPQEKYKQLETEFQNLYKGFNRDIIDLTQRLASLTDQQNEEYFKLMVMFQRKFFGVLEIQAGDSLYDIATKYIGLPENGKEQGLSWFQLVDYILKTQTDKDKIKVGDVIIVPVEYTLVRELLNYETYIDLGALLKNGEIKYRNGFENLSDEAKLSILDILKRFFQYRGQKEKTVSIIPQIFEILERNKEKYKTPPVQITPMPAPIDSGSSNSDIFSESGESPYSIYPKPQLERNGNKEYVGISGCFEAMGDGFYNGVFQQLQSYEKLINNIFGGEIFNNIMEIIRKLCSESGNIYELIKEVGNSISEQFRDFFNAFTDFYEFGRLGGKMFVNIIIGTISGGLAGGVVKGGSVLAQKLGKFGPIIENSTKGISTIFETIQHSTGIKPELLSPQSYLNLRKGIRMIDSKGKEFNFLGALGKESLFYTDHSLGIILYNEGKRIVSSIGKINFKELFGSFSDKIKLMIGNSGELIISFSKELIKPENLGKLGLWGRRLSASHPLQYAQDDEKYYEYAMNQLMELIVGS